MSFTDSSFLLFFAVVYPLWLLCRRRSFYRRREAWPESGERPRRRAFYPNS